MAPTRTQARRAKPNILVTGTPGTGKTTTSSLVAEATQLRHINVGDLVKEKGLHDGWDEELRCHILNEDLVCDELEDMMEEEDILAQNSLNIECEIFQVLLEEAKTSYREDIVMALQSDSLDDISGNVSTLAGWVNDWIPGRSS